MLGGNKQLTPALQLHLFPLEGSYPSGHLGLAQVAENLNDSWAHVHINVRNPTRNLPFEDSF